MCWLCCCRVSGHGSPAALERPIMESQEECHVQSRTLGSATQLWNHGKNILYMKRILGSEGEIIRGVRGKSQKRRVWGGYDLSHWEGKNRHDMEQQEEYHLNIYIYMCVYIYIYTRRTKLIGGDTSLHFGQKGNKRGTIMGISHIKRIVEELLS